MKARTFGEWEAGVPEAVREDALWTMEAYRLALFAADLAHDDCVKLMQRPLSRPLADQLYRAAGSIGANLAEGYSRSGKRDRAHFFEYALGSAREARHWYLQTRDVLNEPVTNHRIELHTSNIRLLIRTIRDSRAEANLDQRMQSPAR